MSGMSRRGENTECKIYVGDLPRDAEEKEIERAFGHYGPIRSVWVARNPPGFAFLEYDDVRDAEDAVRGLDGATVCGARVRVEHATGKIRPKPWNGMRGGGGGGGGGGYGGRSGGGYGGRGPPQSRSRDGFGSGGRGYDPNDRCYVCNERGHYSYDCPSKSGGGGRSGGSRRRSPSRSRSRSGGRNASRSVSRSRSPVDRRGSNKRRSPSRESK